MLVVLAALVPLVAQTTIAMIPLALAAAALILYGGTRTLPATGLGVLLLVLELQTAWNKHPLTIQIASAVIGVALLAALELSTWADELARTRSDQQAYRARARELGTHLAVVAVLSAGLVVLARGVVHGPVLGILGGLAAVSVGAGLIWLTSRSGGRA